MTKTKNNQTNKLANQWFYSFHWLKKSKQRFLFEDDDSLSQLNKKLFKLNLGLILFSTFFILVSFVFLPPVIPLFFSAPWGRLQLAPKETLFLLPIIMLIMTSIALFITKKIKFVDEIIIRNLFGSTLLFNLMLAIAIIKIIWIVI